MRRPLALLLCAPLLLLAACGDSAKERSASQPGKTEERETGEQSVEGFGHAATGQEQKQVLAAERGYLRALSARDFKTACTYLSASVTQSLRRAAVAELRAKRCPAIVPKLLAPGAIAVAKEHLKGKVTKVRVEGRQAFVIYRAPGAKLYVFTILREAGGWKVTTLIGSVLVPSPPALGAG
jgi:hypothetical protein